MKRIIAFVIAIMMIVPVFATTQAFATDNGSTVNNNGSSNTGNSETDELLNDYGYNITLDSIKGYDESNGDVKNSPFGKNYVENYTLVEPVFYSNLGFLIEGKTDAFGEEARPSQSDVNSYQNYISLSNADMFEIINSGELISSFRILESKTAAGDFDRDTRNNGVACVFVSPGAIYLGILDPLDLSKTSTCMKIADIPQLSTVEFGDYSNIISIHTGNVIPGNTNKLGISPDEIVISYPVESFGKIKMMTAVYSLSSFDEGAWKDMNNWTQSISYTTDVDEKLMFMTVGDIDEDGYDDIVNIVSSGVSQLKLDKKTSQKSKAAVYVTYGGSGNRTKSTEISGLYRVGGAITDINNDGKPNLVLCGINDISTSASSITLSEVAVTLESNLKESFRATTSSTVSGNLVDDLENTLRLIPVVIKTEQRADNGNNRITGAVEDSPHSVMYDGMFLVGKTLGNQMSFAGSGRASYMKDGRIMTYAHSGMVYTTLSGVAREDIFLCYSSQIFTHPEACEFERTYDNQNMKTQGYYANVFALPNLDYDSGILRYDGWTMNFTEPELHAILAAAPYFGDFSAYNMDYILEGSTTYSSTSSYGKGLEKEWNAGVTGELDFGVVKVEASVGYQGSWSRNTTITNSTEFSASKETLAVVATIPVEIYYYTLFICNPDGELVAMSYKIPVPHERVYSMLTIPEYDKAAAKNGKETLSGNVIIHTDGDPSSYNYTNEWIESKYDEDNIHSSDDWYRTTHNAGSISASIEVETETEKSHGFYISGSITGGGKVVSGGVEGGGGRNYITTEGNGTGYSTSVRNITKEMHGAVEGGYGFQWRMKTFNAKIDGNEIPVITYEVKNASTNPRMPLNVSARGCEAYDEDGNRIPANKITWEANPADENKDISYAIMRKNAFTGALQTIATVPYGTFSYIDTKDLEFGTDYEYAVRAVKNLATAANRYSLESLTETAKTLSEYGAPTVLIASEKVNVSLGDIATMTVTVSGELSGRKLEYQWYCRRPDSYEGWEYITDANSASYDAFATSYLLSGTEYRCVVMETITREDGKKEIIYCYSDVIKLVVE